jgi:class 3 adenylate cyclase/outer membrane protein assembly factor BamB
MGALEVERAPRRAHTAAMVRRRQDHRGLTTLLFTDIVGSSDVAVELGDRRWKTLQNRHHSEVRKQLKRHGGHEVDTAGDGFFVTFGSPDSGVRCAFAIVESVRELGLNVRAGLHIGAAELSGEKVSGIAVTTAARVSALAASGQVLVTSTIVQLVPGSGLEFTDLGTRELKGVPGTWELFALAAVDEQPVGEPLDPTDAAEARNRSSPKQAPKRSPRVALVLLTSALAVILVGSILTTRGRTGSGSPEASSTSPPVAAALVALMDGTGLEAFSIDLPALRTNTLVGPIVFTGRVDTPVAFAWMPTGFASYGLRVAEVNRTSGAVADPARTFKTNTTTCVCVASAEGRLWTPVSTGKIEPNGVGDVLGVSLRGFSPREGSYRDVLVDDELEFRAVSALVSGAGYLWMADSASDRLYRVDPETSDVLTISLRQSPDMLVFADGGLWVLDRLDAKITRVDPETGRSLRSFTSSGNLQSFAVGGGNVWAADTSVDEIQRIPEDLRSASTPISVRQFGDTPKAVAYDNGSIVVGFNNGTISKIDTSDPTSPEVIWTHRVGNNASSIAIAHGIVWVGGGPTADL